MNGFINLGPTKHGVKTDLEIGFKAALEALTELTSIQQEKKLWSSTEGALKVLNKGRIVIVTKLNNEQEIRNIREKFMEMLLSTNKTVTISDSHMPIIHCDLVLLNFCNENERFPFENKVVPDYSPLLSYEIFSIGSGANLAPKLCSLVLRHYDLASTTVTGIPMKEEQNASSSANYDVELFHPAKAHTAILKGIPSETAHLKTIRVGTDYETVTLKWCTPRSSANMELQQCSSAYRITSVDVNSRPSSCLTNFLLNGRWVMLEMPRKTGGKVISHMLACHGGDIYIHTMYTARSVLEDPPSISEGVGGRVADYRIPEFGEFIRNSLLAPHPTPQLEDGEDPQVRPIDSSKNFLKKQTRIWPMTGSASTFFALDKTVSKFIRILIKDVITEDEVVECKNTIFEIMNMEARGDLLPNVNIRGGNKNFNKREEQYKMVWVELEHFLRTYNDSPKHQKVLDCLLECQNRSTSNNKNESTNVDIDQALMEIESNNSRDLMESENKRKKESETANGAPNAKKKRLLPPLAPIGKRSSLSLLSLWENKVSSEHANKCKEFKGRLEAENNVTPLYKNLVKEKDDNKKNDFDSRSKK